ncbi:hypothetical protein QP938_11550 [Porticoccaceae bacterium LTM1]|nr:hypothetical protein QP938_11550 [Porticoccaceae bacterium LTM1]
MKLDNVKISEFTFGHVLRLVREVAVIGVSIYMAVRIFSGDLSLDFTKLSPPELVSILLAFFSIALAAAFYFAATNASNQFYDNINKFNKDTSELLGRLDEQIKHVNTRQKELGDRIDRRYIQQSIDQEDDERREENEEQIAKVKARWEESLNQILNVSTIEPEEKKRLEEELKKKDDELNVLREEQAKLKARTVMKIKSYLRRKVSDFGLEEAVTFRPDELLYILARKAAPLVRKDMCKYGLLYVELPNSPSDITEKGEDIMSSVVSSMIESDA